MTTSNKKNDLESRVHAIELRNARVELDKSWETSKTRRFAIVLLTYFFAVLFMYQIGVDDFALAAIVPTVGFFLSTLGLNYIRRLWENKV